MGHDAATGKVSIRARFAEVGGSNKVKESFLGAPPPADKRWRKCDATNTLSEAYLEGGIVTIVEAASTAPPSSPGGTHYVSHAMLALVDHDPNFWIGKAYELEGRDGTPLPDLTRMP